MEYIISGADVPVGDIYEDETYCTRGLCAHPSCWESHIRQTRGFRRYVSLSAEPSAIRRQIEDEEDSDDGLATIKVLNMLDEYGESTKDLYPSRHNGLPTHKRLSRTLADKNRRNRPSPDQPVTPMTSPSHNKVKMLEDILEPTRKEATVKQVEVQEVFDLEELSQNWDSTFLTKPMYVWIPGKNKKRPTRRKMKSSDSVRSQSIPDPSAMKDVTNEMLPRRASHRMPAAAAGSRQPIVRSRSPLPTGGQPYHNVGQTPKDRMRFRVIMNELKDLPRPFVLEVLEKARSLDSKEDVLMLMERYLKTMRKSDWELSMVTGQVLRQMRLNSKMFEHSERLNTVPVKQVYKLDDSEHDDQTQTQLSAVPADVMEESVYSSNRYRPLPDIAAPPRRKKHPVRVHVSTTTDESVKPFQYRKQADMEFCLGPTRSLSTALSRPQSDKTLQSARQPTIVGADLSVLYDQESVDRNANHSANMGRAKLKAGADTHPNGSGASSAVPKAPAGTPYTPKTPFKDKQCLEAPAANQPSPDGVALEVIEEMAVVDEFGANSRRVARGTYKTTKSAIEARSVASPVVRRVVSANPPTRMVLGGLEMEGRRALSAGASMAVADVSSVKGSEQVLDPLTGLQMDRATASRLDIVSTTSNWPNVDEEALLREQTNAEGLRVSSAPGSKVSKESLRRSATLPASATDKDTQKTTIVVNLQPLRMRENSPAPPPPSPEPADKMLKSRPAQGSDSNVVISNSNDPLAGAAVDLSGISDPAQVPGQSRQAEAEVKVNQTAVDQSELSTTVVAQSDPGNSTAANQSDCAKLQRPHSSAELKGKSTAEALKEEQQVAELHERMELNIGVPAADPLSLVPESLYKEMDLEREITLSALPPSALDTPEVSSVNLRQLGVTPIVDEAHATTASPSPPAANKYAAPTAAAAASERPAEAVAPPSSPVATDVPATGAKSSPDGEAVKFDDQGGFFGQ